MIIITSFRTQVKGQEQLPAHIDTSFFSWSPGHNHKVVNGITVGWTAHPWSTWSDTTFVKVNGVNLEVGPLGIIGGLYGTLIGLVGVEQEKGKRVSFFSNSGYASTTYVYPTYGTYINGLSVSIGGMKETYNHGLFLNGLSGFCYELEGVQVSGLINYTDRLSGVSVAALANVATEAKGLQIGLINKCQTGKVLQIGLFNRIGRRVVPVINLNWKKVQTGTSTRHVP
ncbi:hypothetical protein [Edaphocola aurantiacus]|uniref:hypothetical protein n=1 Tax=Edaphocola aurantiacus TaxID=2601682 RepID=UPI001C94C263|nr:hypothetical protein [Edaphocola aurantiacus]